MKDDSLERWLLLACLAAAGILAAVTAPADPLLLLTAFLGWGSILWLPLAALSARLRAIASILLVTTAAMNACSRRLDGRAGAPATTNGGRAARSTAREGRRP